MNKQIPRHTETLTTVTQQRDVYYKQRELALDELNWLVSRVNDYLAGTINRTLESIAKEQDIFNK